MAKPYQMYIVHMGVGKAFAFYVRVSGLNPVKPLFELSVTLEICHLNPVL